MSDLLKKCQEFFYTSDFYEVLKINQDASEKEIKKAYHRLSLIVHPDRVEDNKKIEATEKFKVLGKIHSILQDSEKRKVYDDCGEFDEESDCNFNWVDYWKAMFKPISIEDIENYVQEYIGSETELQDIKKAYAGGKGNMDYILEMVPFSNCDSEERITEIVRKMVDSGELEEYDCFFNEPQKKKNKRKRKLEKERKVAESVSAKDLLSEIEKNNERRVKQFSNFMSDLEAKYDNKAKKRSSIKGSPSENKRTTRSSKK